jgi:pyridoxine 4-dehydrogenase
MSSVNESDTFKLGDRTVKRLGYGAMQLAGRGVFGPPKDHDAALAILREAVASGVNHIDTADFYGPHVTNQIIREALAPYRDDLVIVTKIGARRGEDGSWIPAFSREELTQAVHDNLRNLGLDVLDVVNLRSMLDVHHPAEGSLEGPLTVLADLQRKGLVRHIGLSNVTPAQIAEGRRICEIACVQNYYNLAHRADDALIDDLALQGIAYVPFFPLGGFTPLQSSTLSDVAGRLGATPMQVALAWLLRRAPNILLIPGTSSVAHLRENLAAGQLTLSPQAWRSWAGLPHELEHCATCDRVHRPGRSGTSSNRFTGSSSATSSTPSRHSLGVGLTAPMVEACLVPQSSRMVALCDSYRPCRSPLRVMRTLNQLMRIFCAAAPP